MKTEQKLLAFKGVTNAYKSAFVSHGPLGGGRLCMTYKVGETVRAPHPSFPLWLVPHPLSDCSKAQLACGPFELLRTGCDNYVERVLLVEVQSVRFGGIFLSEEARTIIAQMVALDSYKVPTDVSEHVVVADELRVLEEVNHKAFDNWHDCMTDCERRYNMRRYTEEDVLK